MPMTSTLSACTGQWRYASNSRAATARAVARRRLLRPAPNLHRRQQLSSRGHESGARELRLRGTSLLAIARPGVADDSSIDYSGPKATLNEQTVWRLQLALGEGTPPAVLKVRFRREEGYEPPQGVVEVVGDEAGVAEEGAETRWELGEDPDKKSENPMDGGGLWIWALFSETPFPCMLFSLQLKEYGKVYVKATHGQGPKRGTVLTEGAITTRIVTEVPADLIGLSKAQISEAQPAGTVRFSPLDRY